jgi:hypothetical protein
MNSSDTVRLHIDSARKKALPLGVLGIILAVVFGFMASRNTDVHGWQQFFQSYILAYMYWFAITLGCMVLLMIHHVTGGWWGYPIRRILEAGTRMVPWMAVLFIPVLVGLSQLYPWTWPGVIPVTPFSHFKQVYLTRGFFTGRAIVCFAIWLLYSNLLNNWSKRQDETGDPVLQARLARLSAPGLVVWAITISIPAFDWIMSLEPMWYSTIFGMLFMVINLVTALSFSLVVLRALSSDEPLKDCVPAKDYVDLGSLLLAFILLWTYMSFSQFLIIWAGNLKGEIPWYMTRAFGGWAPVAVALILFHFFMPFLLLLQRAVKRRVQVLGLVAGWMMILSFVDIYWLIAPSYEPAGPRIHLVDIFSLVGIGGLWIAGFCTQLKKMPLLPLHDPRFEQALEHTHGH